MSTAPEYGYTSSRTHGGNVDALIIYGPPGVGGTTAAITIISRAPRPLPVDTLTAIADSVMASISAIRIRRSSVIAPDSSCGTLKSTRMRTVLPRGSMSATDFLAMAAGAPDGSVRTGESIKNGQADAAAL